MLQLTALSKTYGAKKIIDTVSLTVGTGEIALLLGQSGVGKSTLLRILNNLENIDSGSVTLNNAPLDIKANPTTHTVGMVFQQFNLFEHLTIEQNITLPLEKVLKIDAHKACAIAQDLLAKYGLAEKKSVYPSSLSGGQKQRLAIARAIAMKPAILCFDEPTSALDPFLSGYVAQEIQALADQGYIVLVASHDISLLERMRCTIYLMQAGRIVESATSQAFKNNPEQFPMLKKFISGNAD